MASYDELRAWLETELEYSITSRDWENFQRDVPEAFFEYDADLDEDEKVAFGNMSRTWHGWSKKGRGGRPEGEKAKSASGTDPRFAALAEVLTIRSRRDPDVIDFRRDILKGNLVGQDDVESWIKATADTDGPATRFVPDHDTGFPHFSKQLIRYVTTYEMGWVLAQPIRIGGKLWRLQGVARRITQGFGWPEEWMVTFILTDEPPPQPMTFGYTTHESTSLVPTMDWLELRVNPRAVSPRELDKAYRKLRSGLMEINRVDPISHKTAALAVHWERTKEKSIMECRAEWNRLFPEWKYSEGTGNFGRDARAAHRQVVGEDG